MCVVLQAEKWNISSISVNKGCYIISNCSHHFGKLVSPEGIQEGKSTWHLTAIRCSHSPQWNLRKVMMWKHRILAPDSWGSYQRNDFSESRLLHLPIDRKELSSLKSDIHFSFIYDNLLMFKLPALCSKTFI